MSRAMFLGVVGAAVFAVIVLAVLTPTVIVDDDGPQAGVVRIAAPLSPLVPRRLSPAVPGARRALPLRPRARALRGLRECLRSHGFRRPGGARPGLETMRKALQTCRGTMRGVPFGTVPGVPFGG